MGNAQQGWGWGNESEGQQWGNWGGGWNDQHNWNMQGHPNMQVKMIPKDYNKLNKLVLVEMDPYRSPYIVVIKWNYVKQDSYLIKKYVNGILSKIYNMQYYRPIINFSRDKGLTMVTDNKTLITIMEDKTTTR